ncbi:hypothetical protein C0638_01205 [Paenibacillus sp. lzh-N1]|uniref:hypothetical protein n=1 Tax=Paenibacillus sp. lzh-N1 TaxID=2069255 RepID=UPI000C8098B9|nr:hypothetical protein [Paenibacillus sp. lzh-N1]AUO05284.1 hypothetical protein C0638_01205 [Paenibacillus sp. lzh-N1]
MSLCVAASFEREHYLAVDTAVSFHKNGLVYRNVDGFSEKIKIIDGEAYFFSGDIELCLMLQVTFMEQKDRSFTKLTEIAKDLFDKYADPGDKLAFAKYGFDKDGKATMQFNNSELDFKPQPIYYGSSNIQFTTYGSKMRLAGSHIDLKTTYITPDFFIPIYEAVADEGIGRSIYMYHIKFDEHGRTEEIPIADPVDIRKASMKKVRNHSTFIGDGEDAFPCTIAGEGDGAKKFDSSNAFDPAMIGEPMSSKGFMIKPKGSYEFLYYSSNTGKERSVKLRDNDVTISAEGALITISGKNISIIMDSGSLFELTNQGLNANIQGSVSIKSSKGMKFDAPRYDFV